MNGVFPPDYIAAAQRAERKWRVFASVTLAQWALESSWGARNMGTANNCFGLKPWRADQPTVVVDTHEVIAGERVAVKQRFCSFASIGDCFDAHGEFLVRNTRYKPAFATADGIAFARAIAKAGYATDPDYADKLVSLIRRYGLTQFDQPRIVLPREPAPARGPIAPTKTAATFSAAAAVGSAAVAVNGGPSGFWVVAFAALVLLVLFLILHFHRKA